jgi:hypothetical protein
VLGNKGATCFRDFLKSVPIQSYFEVEIMITKGGFPYNVMCFITAVLNIKSFQIYFGVDYILYIYGKCLFNIDIYGVSLESSLVLMALVQSNRHLCHRNKEYT